MSSGEQMFSYHIKRLAEERGYNDARMTWEIGFCQGDYVELSCTDLNLNALADQLMSGKEKRTIKKLIKADLISISIDTGTAFGESYDHPSGKELTDHEDASFSSFVEKIGEDAKCLQRSMLRDGHDLFMNLPSDDGEVLREFNMENVSVRFSFHPEDCGGVEDEENGYPDYCWASILDVIDNHLWYGYLKVLIEDHDSGEEHYDTLGCFWARKDEGFKAFLSDARDVLRNIRYEMEPEDTAEAA